MIFLTTQNRLPEARSPTVGTYRNQKVINPKDVVASTVTAFRHIHGVPAQFQTNSTPDGLDAVCWTTLGSLKFGAKAHYTVAIVLSNSRRQKTALYGGVVGSDWSLVFDKYTLKTRNADLDELMREAVSHWSMFIDHYAERLRRLKNTKLTRSRYNSLLVAAADGGYISWSKLGPFHDERPDDETALTFLQRFSRHVSRQPVISHEPPRSQPWSMLGMYLTVCEQCNP